MKRSLPIALLAAGLLPGCHESSSTIVGSDVRTDAGHDVAAESASDVPGEDPSTGCAAVCARTYFEDVSECIRERRNCLVGCEWFGNWECEEGCELVIGVCTSGPEAEIEGCMGECPCWTSFMGCTEDCGDPGDACWARCEDTYSACSGEDITGLGSCMEACALSSMGCGDACSDRFHGINWVSWLDCSTSCELDLQSCMIGCF